MCESHQQLRWPGIPCGHKAKASGHAEAGGPPDSKKSFVGIPSCGSPGGPAQWQRSWLLPLWFLRCAAVLKCLISKSNLFLNRPLICKSDLPKKKKKHILLSENMNFYHQWEFAHQFRSSSTQNVSCYQWDPQLKPLIWHQFISDSRTYPWLTED